MRTRGFVFALLIAFLLLGGSAASAQETGAQTPSSPLTEADRDLLVKVRQAGLWEMPAGDQAQQRAASPRVKQVGRQLAADHMKLDEAVVKTAEQLGVTLPGQPSADQQSWLDELANKSGPEFDRTFADRLRAAHGKVFTTVAMVRSSTRNNMIRQFAQVAVDIVMKHMTLLESTQLVSDAGLSDPVPAGAVPTAQANSGGDGPSPLLVALLCVAGAAATVGLLRTVHSRSRR